MNDLERIEDLKNKLEQSKEKLANIRGKISAKEDQLVAIGFKKSKNILDDVDKELIRLNKEIKTDADKLDEMIVEFKEKFPSIFEE